MKPPKSTQLLPFLFSMMAVFLFSASAMGQKADSTKKSKDLPIDPPKRFSMVFNRGFAMPGPAQDTVPLSSTASGSYFVGAGFMFPLGKRNIVGLRAAPGLAWTHFAYQQSIDKTFPSIRDSVGFDYTQEKHRLLFLEMPLGVYFNITRDEDGDPLFFAEAGGYLGYLASATYKIKYRNSAGQRVMERTKDLEQITDPEIEFERLRYGVYARVGYKWFSLYYSMRLTNVFDEFTNPSLRPRDVNGYKNPTMPPMEIGLSLFL